MENKDLRIIKKILEYIKNIKIYCKDIKTAKELQKNSMLAEAVCFDILQIGELAKDGLSEKCKEQITNIPWSQIYGLRNRIVHGYDNINFEIIFETIKEDIPLLEKELKKIK